MPIQCSCLHRHKNYYAEINILLTRKEKRKQNLTVNDNNMMTTDITLYLHNYDCSHLLNLSV